MKSTFILLLLFTSLVAIGQNPNSQRLRNFNTNNGIALREFDPMSYFKGKPVKGTEKFQYDHKGITYYFANAANLEEFKKSPAKFEPAYGGWCAYSLAAQGKKEKSDPATYKIIDGKVYLFHNYNGKNYMMSWMRNEKKYKEAADARWKKIMN
jgi:YHS domain-containing protein